MLEKNNILAEITRFIQIIKKTQNEKIYNELNIFVNSFLWKICISEYHIEQISDAFIQELSCFKQTEYIESIKGMLASCSEKSNSSNYKIAILKSEAHLIAFAQSLHSLADICAHIVNYSIPVRKDSFTGNERDITLYKIKNRLKLPTTQNLKQSIIDLQESQEFKYLSAFVNTTKHKSLVPVEDFVSFEDSVKPCHCFKIDAFDYNSNHFKSMFSSVFAEEYYLSLRRLYKEIFKELGNIIVKNKKTSP